LKVDWAKIKYFNREEFICPHCGREEMKHRFLLDLDTLRAWLNKPMHVSSGWRCPEYNKSKGGAENSPHMHGLAADISCSSAVEARNIVHKADEIGIMGIGVYDKHIHLDDFYRLHGKEVIWGGISK